jgi:hypothetical protein
MILIYSILLIIVGIIFIIFHKPAARLTAAFWHQEYTYFQKTFNEVMFCIGGVASVIVGILWILNPSLFS